MPHNVGVGRFKAGSGDEICAPALQLSPLCDRPREPVIIGNG
jgi:hypothetical protein